MKLNYNRTNIILGFGRQNRSKGTGPHDSIDEQGNIIVG